MTSILSTVLTIWLACGLIAAVWFHVWRKGCGYLYRKRWEIPLEYGAVCLSGPVGLVLAGRRAYRWSQSTGKGGDL